MSVSSTPLAVPADAPEWLKIVAGYVSRLDYGQVVITVHQGEVIQVETTQRTRLQKGANPKG